MKPSCPQQFVEVLILVVAFCSAPHLSAYQFSMFHFPSTENFLVFEVCLFPRFLIGSARPSLFYFTVPLSLSGGGYKIILEMHFTKSISISLPKKDGRGKTIFAGQDNFASLPEGSLEPLLMRGGLNQAPDQIFASPRKKLYISFLFFFTFPKYEFAEARLTIRTLNVGKSKESGVLLLWTCSN